MRRHNTTAAALVAALVAGPAMAQDDAAVRVTPLGSHDGEFCSRDRAMVFEDPNGTRILYDAGRTVAGPDDPRLGEIDVVLVSHMHGDHVGDSRIEATGAGTCASPDTPVSAFPASNSVDIAVAKGATMVTGSEMAAFFGNRMAAAGGDASNSKLARFGSSQEFDGVMITTVVATHSNAVPHGMMEGELGEMLKAAGVGAYVGPPTGYVLEFTNGLVVYLSGDTGLTAEQEIIVGDHYGAELAVMNIGDVYTTGPTQAAYVIDELIEPELVIPSHANEAATENGTVVDGTKTATFMEAVETEAYLPLSGRTLSFDAEGRCVAGCD